jgi:hypothetical protein
MITKEIAIEAILEKLEEMNTVSNNEHFNNWRKKTIGTLKRIVPENVTIINQLTELHSFSSITFENYTSSAIEGAKILLESLIGDLKKFGIEETRNLSTDKPGLSVNFNQHNNQTQTTSINIKIDFLIEVLKGELRTSEIEEVKEILESDDEPTLKKKKFIEKIKSFGSDVATNILANILTNPQVYEQMGKIL